MRPFCSTALTFAILALSSQARADITVCNDFRAPVSVALAYEESGGFISEGWWKIESNACRDIPFKGIDFYYTAESDSYREGGRQSRHNWGRGRHFHVGKGNFKFDNAERARRGARSLAFSEVRVSDSHRSTPHILTLRFKSGETTVEVKSKPGST